MDAEKAGICRNSSDQQSGGYYKLCDGRVRTADACLWSGYDRRSWDCCKNCTGWREIYHTWRTGAYHGQGCPDDLWRRKSSRNCRYHGWGKLHDHRWCQDHALWGSMLWRCQHPKIFKESRASYRCFRKIWKGSGSEQCKSSHWQSLPVSRRIRRRRSGWRNRGCLRKSKRTGKSSIWCRQDQCNAGNFDFRRRDAWLFRKDRSGIWWSSKGSDRTDIPSWSVQNCRSGRRGCKILWIW